MSDPLALFIIYTVVIWLCGVAVGVAFCRREVERYKRRAELYRLGLGREMKFNAGNLYSRN